jgi:hypothetical protein
MTFLLFFEGACVSIKWAKLARSEPWRTLEPE